MNNMSSNKPVASLTNRKTTLQISDVPAKLGRNDNVVDVYFFHNSVSREHCLFECVSRRFTVKDLGSTAGTFINGVQLEPGVPYYIEEGDKISIGHVKFVFHADYEELGRREQNAARKGKQGGMPNAGQQGLPGSGQPMGMQQNKMPERQPMGMPQNNNMFVPEEDVIMQNYGAANIPQGQGFGQPAMNMNQPGSGNAAGSIFRGPDGKKRVIVSARPLVQFEYDDNEVIHIDTGFSASPIKQRYTQDIPKEEITKAEKEAAAAPEPSAPAEPAPEPKVYTAPAASETPEPAVSAAAEPHFVPEPDLPFEDEPTAVILDAPAAKRRPVMILKWRDEDTGENGELTVDHFPFYIGRKSTDNDFSILKRGLSRRHFGFLENEGAVFVFDDDSTNGVWVNGAKIERGHNIRLMKRDIIEAGNVKFTVVEV